MWKFAKSRGAGGGRHGIVGAARAEALRVGEVEQVPRIHLVRELARSEGIFLLVALSGAAAIDRAAGRRSGC